MKILMLDEQKLSLKIIADFLDSSGHTVRTVDSLSDFLCEFETDEVPEIIMIDPGQEKTRAIKVIEKANQLYPDADILILERVDMETQDALKRRVYAFLKKPIHLKELELTIYRIAEKRNMTEKFEQHLSPDNGDRSI